MSGPFIISVLSLAVTLFAVSIACVLLIHITRKALDRNNELTSQVQKLKSDVSPIEKIREDISASDNPAQMTDPELLAWLDCKLDETLLYTNPELDTKKISESFGISQRRINRLMKLENSPGSVASWLAGKRIRHACKLLTSRHEITIEAISQEAGFRSRRTFQNLFKQALGVTPSEYRNRAKNPAVPQSQNDIQPN